MSTALDGSLGIGVQSAYDTSVTPTRWYPILSSQLDPEFIETADRAIMGGGFGSRKSARKRVGYGAAGSVSMEVLNQKMALLLGHVTGTAAAGVATGSGYTYTMPFTRNFGKFLTIQEGVPDESATQPLTMVGGKIVTATFSCEMDGTLEMDLALDGRSVVDDVALASATYTAGLVPFDWSQSSVKIGTYASEVELDGITSVEVALERPLKTDGRYAGSNGYKSEPSMNGRPTVTGSLEVDFRTKADFLDRYLDNTEFSLVWEFIGTAGTGYSETFRITLPSCKFDTSAPGLEGEEEVSHTMDFTAMRDDVNGRAIATVTYISADASA